MAVISSFAVCLNAQESVTRVKADSLPARERLESDTLSVPLKAPVLSAGTVPFSMYGITPFDYAYTAWELHKGFNASVGLNVTFSPSRYAPSGAGFGQNAAFMYAVPVTDRLSVAAGIYANNFNWGFIDYRNVGFAAVAARSAAKFLIALRRSFGYALSPDGLSYLSKRLVHRLALPFIPRIPGEYDLCLSFIDPHYIAVHRTRAKRVIGWLHTDFGAIGCASGADIRMWDGCDRIATVSHSCKRAFDSAMSSLAYKSFVAENILSCNMVKSQSLAALGAEMDRGAFKLLSVGRFAHAKNFDNIPDICHRIRKFGYDCVWYIIGYGGDEELIKRRIKEAGCGDSVILLGRRDNP